jgi:hypothetical protein
MTTFNNVLGTLSGPRRLRSVLRQKTVAIQSLLVALDSPTELRETIPAAVFGGDIFGVMSQQLQEALVIPPPPSPVVPGSHRKRALPSLENSFAQHSSSNFLPLAKRQNQSTLSSETLQTASFRQSERVLLEAQTNGARITENRHAENLRTEDLRTENRRLQQLVEPSAAIRLQTLEPSTLEAATYSIVRGAPTAPALINSLNRYWKSLREINNTTRANEPGAGSERPEVSRKLIPSDVEQPGASVWPNSIIQGAFKNGSSLNDRRDSLNEDTHSVAGRSPRSAPLKSFADRDPDFNFHPADNHAPHYDDLGDRLAQILHEQALQHGIDVT